MNQFMELNMRLPPEQVSDLRRYYFQNYGTTLRGLQKHHQVDPDEYLAYVHDISLLDYLEPASGLHEMIASLPQDCWIFTNADSDHARRVLTVMGLSDCFNGIIDIRSTGYACKPQPESFLQALSIAGNPSEKKCVMIDDSPRNLQTAHELGMTTILVDGESESRIGVDYHVPDLLSLPEEIPELW